MGYTILDGTLNQICYWGRLFRITVINHAYIVVAIQNGQKLSIEKGLFVKTTGVISSYKWAIGVNLGI